MITLSAKIKMLSSESGTLSAVGYLNGNNISSEIPLGEKKQAKSPFFIGSSRFNGERFLKSVDYFIGSEISDENGNFETTYSFTITGKNISIFTIAFNDEKNSHPKSIIVDGVEYYDDDAIFTIETSLSDTHSIIINNWNKPLEPLVITGIYINYSIVIDTRNLQSLDFSIMRQQDFVFPSWGIISNGGNLSFVDKNEEAKDYYYQGLLKSGLDVEIGLTDYSTRKSRKIGSFKTKEINYDNDNKLVEISFNDELIKWQDINLPPIPNIDEITLSRKSIYEFFQENIYPYIPTAQKNKLYFEVEAENRLKKTICQSLICQETKTLWYHIQSICEIGAIYCFKDWDDKIKFSCEFED